VPSARTLAFPVPASMVASAAGQSVNASTIGSRASLATSRSMSPIVAFHRRIDPHTSTDSTASRSARYASASSATGRASPRRVRSRDSRANGTLSKMFSSVLAPNPDTVWISPASAAASSSSKSVIPSASYSEPTVFGPTPSTAVSPAMSTGSSSRSADSSAIAPVSTYSTIFAAMASPTRSISATASSPSAASPSIGAGWSRTFSAARR